MVSASRATGQTQPPLRTYWGEEPVEELSSLRGRRVLNGLWRFMPAAGAALAEPQGEWGWIRVPGAWHAQGWAVAPIEGIVAAGSGGSWTGVDLATLGRGWYEREILVPAGWRGREILLTISRLCTDARVFVNNQPCGEINWPGGSLALTDHVRPGRRARLRMLVVAAWTNGAVKRYMAGQRTGEQHDGQSVTRGLVGDVILESRPKGTHVGGVFVRTSVRRKELAVDVDLAGVREAAEARFTARVRDAKGRIACSFESARPLTDEQEQTLQLSCTWEDPELWDLGQPHLYALQLQAEGPDWRDEYRQVFGFREFRVEGKQFLLNEKPFRLRPVVCKAICNDAGMREAVENHLDSFMRAGFNLCEIWPKVDSERGLAIYWPLVAEVADTKGLPLMYPVANLTPFVAPRTIGYEGEWWAWEKAMVAEWKRIRNHPSIVVLVCTANAYQHADDQNPMRIGDMKALAADSSTRLRLLFTSGLRAMDTIRKHDRTRPVTAHHGAAVGDFHTCDMYLNMIPLQEREEWLSAWARNEGACPYMAVEFGTPWTATFHRGRENGSQARGSEPFLTEYCAIYFGADAYRAETDGYRQIIRDRYRGRQSYDMIATIPRPDYKFYLNHLRLQSLFIRNTWRSWRTWGMTGGLLPWDNGYGWADRLGPPPPLPPFRPGRRGLYVTADALRQHPHFHDALGYYLGLNGRDVTEAGEVLMEVNSSTLAWIAGAPPAFTAKDHHFLPGATVRKQIVLINDQRVEQDYQLNWTATVAGRRIAVGRKEGTIGVAQNLFVPIEFRTPATNAKADGLISMQVRIGRRNHSDAFRFRVLPSPDLGGGSVLACDPAGDTAALLKRLKWDVATWDGRPAGDAVLLIGRRALDGGGKLPGPLEAFLKAGGRLVIFAQDPQWLRESAGFRVARHVARRFYPVPSQSDNPIVTDLDYEDLRDWLGSGTLVAETSNTKIERDFSDWRTMAQDRLYGWHWGNRGSVSSAAVEKPHRSRWRPVLEGEFDLAYSPLMELYYGGGLVLWCSLDAAGRTTGDPVADLVVDRLLRYAAAVKLPAEAPQTFYAGGQPGRDLLDLLGVHYEATGAVPTPPALLVVGGDYSPNPATFRAFLMRGGKALFLPRPVDSPPPGFRMQPVGNFHGSLNVPAWPECRGLSESDLRLRSDVRVRLLLGEAGRVGADGLLGRLQLGRGVAICVQISPDMLDTRRETYLRLSRWRLTRTVSQLLGNLGATFEADSRFIKKLDSPESPAPAYYHPDYRTDYELGDDPYRYKRW
jgi:beta-galactosidase